ncbi:MAG: hypothetical protein JW720_14510, partial [Sedimentisphaerales bacterium]|nr:hypothetical protein [Sedimentisphaerales bacterium]
QKISGYDCGERHPRLTAKKNLQKERCLIGWADYSRFSVTAKILSPKQLLTHIRQSIDGIYEIGEMALAKEMAR